MKGMAQGRGSGHGVGFVGVFPCVDSRFETPLRVFAGEIRAGLFGVCNRFVSRMRSQWVGGAVVSVFASQMGRRVVE